MPQKVWVPCLYQETRIAKIGIRRTLNPMIFLGKSHAVSPKKPSLGGPKFPVKSTPLWLQAFHELTHLGGQWWAPWENGGVAGKMVCGNGWETTWSFRKSRKLQKLQPGGWEVQFCLSQDKSNCWVDGLKAMIDGNQLLIINFIIIFHSCWLGIHHWQTHMIGYSTICKYLFQTEYSMVSDEPTVN